VPPAEHFGGGRALETTAQLVQELLGARAHAPNEHIRLEDLGHAIRFTHALFEALAEGH
jgi:acetylornithine deacetylase/succinyl-diaminopimelate desuccinylase-like protein